MKKTILPFLALLCSCLFATAQFKSGDVLLGGNLSIGTFNTSPIPNNNTYTKGTNFSINPTIGFFKDEKNALFVWNYLRP